MPFETGAFIIERVDGQPQTMQIRRDGKKAVKGSQTIQTEGCSTQVLHFTCSLINYLYVIPSRNYNT